jgi:predicted nucleic acid-binding protein
MSSRKTYVADTDTIIRRAATLPETLEMHDALIVATALHHKSILITKDQVITQAGLVKTLW